MRNALRNRAIYLWVLFLTPPVATFAHYLAPNRPLIEAQDAGIVVAYLLVGVAALLWFVYRTNRRWSTTTLVFLALVIVTWLYEIARIQLDDTVFNLTALLFPVALVGIALRPASGRDLRVAMVVFGYALVILAAISLVFGSLGVIPDGFKVSDGGGQRFALLTDIGVPGRWGSFLGSVNYASAVGALLVVLGSGLRRWNSWIFLSSGVLLLILGQGRAAVMGAIAGVLIIVLWGPRVQAMHQRVRVRVITCAVIAAGVISYVLLVDPTLSYRNVIWETYLRFASVQPLTGIGNSGVLASLGDPILNPTNVLHDHAHSVLFDGFVRWGIIWLVLSLAIFAMSVVVGLGCLRRGNPLPLGVAVFVLTAGLVETLHSWTYWNFYTAMLVWSVLAADRQSAASDQAQPPDRASLSLHGDSRQRA